jgi:hypothetical protein
MLEFFKEIFWLKRSHAFFFGLLLAGFLLSHYFGMAYFNDIKTERVKSSNYNRRSSFYHK